MSIIKLNENILNQLMKKGIKPYERDGLGKAPIFYAIDNLWVDGVKYIYDKQNIYKPLYNINLPPRAVRRPLRRAVLLPSHEP